MGGKGGAEKAQGPLVFSAGAPRPASLQDWYPRPALRDQLVFHYCSLLVPAHWMVFTTRNRNLPQPVRSHPHTNLLWKHLHLHICAENNYKVSSYSISQTCCNHPGYNQKRAQQSLPLNSLSWPSSTSFGPFFKGDYGLKNVIIMDFHTRTVI